MRLHAYDAMRSLLHRLCLRHCVCLVGAFGVASGCVAHGGNDGAGFIPVSEAGPPTGPTTSTVFEGGARDAQASGEGGLKLDSRCGTTDYCRGSTPDDAHACDGFDADAGGPVRRRDAGESVHFLDASFASSDASSVPRDAGVVDGGDSGKAAHAPAVENEGGVRARALPVPGPIPPPPDAGARYSCQVGRDNSGGPVHQCAPAGDGDDGSPCDSSSDCAPGLGCVGGDASDPTEPVTPPGQCRHYCCTPSEDCGAGAYCAARPLLDNSKEKPLLVPVCAPGDSCALLEPFPCVNGCTCKDPTTTCTVVRSDGTLGCVTPGTGKVNDKCPCAAGYYCSLATSLCVKICKTDGIDDRCAPGKCQAAAGFPTGFGLCVGYTPAMQ
ncbi:MAG TPA: hypothetical protein VHC69_17220 [Polyangiaceae bacterium]|nr:hypothetical protein [Polyangiaceae bacterium]